MDQSQLHFQDPQYTGTHTHSRAHALKHRGCAYTRVSASTRTLGAHSRVYMPEIQRRTFRKFCYITFKSTPFPFVVVLGFEVLVFAVVLSHWHSWTLASASLPWRHSWTSAASLRARRPAFAQTPNPRDDLGTLSWTPPGFCCHLRADADARQRCTQRRSSALLSERNPALVTHEVLERCSSFLPRALTFLAHPTLAANPNPALDHTRRLALQPDTSSGRPLHDIHVHERKLHTKTLRSPTPAARCEAFAGVHRRAFCRVRCFGNFNPQLVLFGGL